MRRRMLDALQGVVETMKYIVRQDDYAEGNVEAIAERALNPDSEDPLDCNNLLPGGTATQIISRWLGSFERTPAQPQQVNRDDIPLD